MNNSVELDYNKAHAFVENNKNNNFFWDGWNIIHWIPNKRGMFDVKGMYHNNKWGIAYKYRVTRKGTWFIPQKYVKHT